jgi:hypothetical protein
VPTDALGSSAGHEANDEAAGDREATAAMPSMCSAGEAGWKLSRWKKKTFVKNAIRRSSPVARYELTTPMPTAIPESGTRRESAVKSLSSRNGSAGGEG